MYVATLYSYVTRPPFATVCIIPVIIYVAIYRSLYASLRDNDVFSWTLAISSSKIGSMYT